MNRFGIPLKVLSTVALAFAFAACSSSSGTPTAPPMTDPNLIITNSANGMVGVQTVHLQLAVTGSINTSGLGSSGSMLGGASLKLDGTSVSGDVDIQKRALHVAVSAPALMGLTADLIQVDGYQYMKYSLAGPKYTKSKSADLGLVATAAPGASLDISKTVDSLKSQLDAAGSKATLVGHEQIEGRDAYHISVVVPTAYINQQLGALGSTTSGVKLDTASLDYWVYSDSVNPAKIDLKASSATIGNVGITVTMTKYNQAVSITAPPASEIQEGA